VHSRTEREKHSSLAIPRLAKGMRILSSADLSLSLSPPLPAMQIPIHGLVSVRPRMKGRKGVKSAYDRRAVHCPSYAAAVPRSSDQPGYLSDRYKIPLREPHGHQNGCEIMPHRDGLTLPTSWPRTHTHTHKHRTNIAPHQDSFLSISL
jgi:hypothetical protein